VAAVTVVPVFSWKG